MQRRVAKEAIPGTTEGASQIAANNRFAEQRPQRALATLIVIGAAIIKELRRDAAGVESAASKRGAGAPERRAFEAKRRRRRSPGAGRLSRSTTSESRRRASRTTAAGAWARRALASIAARSDGALPDAAPERGAATAPSSAALQEPPKATIAATTNAATLGMEAFGTCLTIGLSIMKRDDKVSNLFAGVTTAAPKISEDGISKERLRTATRAASRPCRSWRWTS